MLFIFTSRQKAFHCANHISFNDFYTYQVTFKNFKTAAFTTVESKHFDTFVRVIVFFDTNNIAFNLLRPTESSRVSFCCKQEMRQWNVLRPYVLLHFRNLYNLQVSARTLLRCRTERLQSI